MSATRHGWWYKARVIVDEPAGRASHGRDPIRRRRRIVVFTAVLASILSIGGVAASTFVTSPEEQRANAAAPDASVLTATVERRILASTLVTRGIVGAAKRIEVTPVVAGVDAQIVTASHVEVGDVVGPGQVLVAVSGRPLMVLQGAVPGYRDLKPNDTGADVRQLQRALRSLGHYRGGDKAGHFGTRTKAAVRRLYQAAGYNPADTAGPSESDGAEATRAARDTLTAAEQAVEDVERRMRAGEEPQPGEPPLGSQLRGAEEDLQRAQIAWRDIQARTGTMLPLAEFVFVPDLPVRVGRVGARVGDKVVDPLLVLAVGDLAVEVKLRPDEAPLVRPGMAAQLLSETLGKETAGVVASIGEPTADEADEGANAVYHPVVVKATRPLPSSWADTDVRVTITSARTRSPVLVVPLSAISSAADGRTTVSVWDGQGESQRVDVRVGMSGDGFAEVTPASDGLAEGDQVVVGRQQ